MIAMKKNIMKLNRSSFQIIEASYGLIIKENLTFFDYCVFRMKLEQWKEFLQNQLLISLIKPINSLSNKTTKKEYKIYHWLNRIIKSLGVVICAYFFVNVPNAFARNYMLNKIGFFGNIWQTVIKKEKKEKNFYFSKKFLVIGSLILSISLGAIIYNRETISRVLFTPTFEELPVYARNFVSYTLDERKIINGLNLQKNVETRNQMMELIIKNFGLENVQRLSEGKFNIDHENNEKVFHFLVRVLNQYLRLNIFDNYLIGYEEYFHPTLINEFKNIKDTVGETLIRSVKNNPATLAFFGSYMKEVVTEVVKKKNFDFTPKIQQEMVNELIKIYLQQSNK